MISTKILFDNGVKLPAILFQICAFPLMGDPEITGYVAEVCAENLKEVLNETSMIFKEYVLSNIDNIETKGE